MVTFAQEMQLVRECSVIVQVSKEGGDSSGSDVETGPALCIEVLPFVDFFSIGTTT